MTAMLLDARIYQIAFLLLFLLVGLLTRDWTLHPAAIATALTTCLIGQAMIPAFWSGEGWASLVAQATKSLPSALITALGLSLLLRVDHPQTMVLAAGAAIASKFLLRVGEKHVFNPANFGIVAALTLTQDAWVSPGQWGEAGWLVLLFSCAGGLVLGRVGRWDTSAVFLTAYGGLEAARILWLGWTWDVWAHRLMSGSLLLFALFMMTDPRTIPNARIGRLVWAIAIALLTFLLRNFGFLSAAPIWALFLLAPLTLLLDRLFPSDRFEWSQGASEPKEPVFQP
jgi:Na+-transporting NADH:ubiquinone oxidoreductase subunit NqrB